MQPSKLALTRGRACPGDRVSERRVDPEDLWVSSALSGTPERTMKKNCTCAEEMLGTVPATLLASITFQTSFPRRPHPSQGTTELLPSWRAARSHLQPLQKQSHLKNCVHTTREQGKEVKRL